MIKSVETFIYSLENRDYQVILTRKRMRNIQYRFKEGTFYISAPRLASKALIISGLDKFAPKLIKRSIKPQAIGEDYIFIYGEKYTNNIINIDNSEINVSDRDNLNKQLGKLLLEYVSERSKFFADEMGIDISSYKVKVRNTNTRLGSNSRRTKTLAYSLNLIHFSKEIIDSVVVHELAHCKVFNHSKDFYNVVYQHCPNYNVLRKKLIHSEFK